MIDDLQRLGPVGFQSFAAAALLTALGSGWQAMGAGRDGGRDLYFRGHLPFTVHGSDDGDAWEWYTVAQVKHHASLSSKPQENASWLWSQVRDELDAWSDPSAQRGEVPDNLLIVTNVALTPVHNVGGHDLLMASIAGYMTELADASRDVGDGRERRARHRRLSKLQQWRVWDANQLDALVSAYPQLRQGTRGLLTPGDVLASLADVFDVLPVQDVERGLRAHARSALIGDGNIYFDEAGSGEVSAMPLHEVVIDLPVTLDRAPSSTERPTLLREVCAHADRILKPSLMIDRGPRHLVVVGAPGNGKTTITRFLTQAYRSAFIQGASDLAGDHNQVIAGVTNALQDMGIAFPEHRRWPLRIDLADYAQTHASGDETSILRFAAGRISRRSDLGKITPNALQSWVTKWPWLLVLDGLDEVTEPATRKQLLERVTELVSAAEGDDCDLLVVLTTRPVGYAENLAPQHFARVDLDYLEPDEAVRYGERALAVWLRGDLDRIQGTSNRLRRAAGSASLSPLLRTPLQVLILVVILVGSGTPDPDRYNLFWRYYETVFNRERNKPQIGLQRILQDHGPQIQQLHERVGFELHVSSESAANSLALLSSSKLRGIAWQVLQDAGYKPEDQDAGLLEGILAAATTRLVLLAPHRDEGYGFDVRSLQELMAASYLTTGTPERVLERLATSAPSPHWRNAWLFAAGRLFAQPQEHQHQAIVELVESLDDTAWTRLGPICPVGPALAVEVIDDGMARSQPKWRDRLMSYGLTVLNAPRVTDTVIIARTLIGFADIGADQRRIVVDALRDALGGPRQGLSRPGQESTAMRVQRHMRGVLQAKHVRPETRDLAAIQHLTKTPPGSEAPDRPAAWREFGDELATANLTDDAAARAALAGEALRDLDRAEKASATQLEILHAALADEAIAQTLCAALSYVAPISDQLVRLLRDEVLPPLYRAPIGDLLRE